GKRTRIRLPLAALFVLSAFVGVTQAQARPTHADLEAAKSQLASLNTRMDGLVEQYDQAQVALSKAEQQLGDARTRVAQADATASRATRELNRRATLAYEGAGSELDTLFTSTDI